MLVCTSRYGTLHFRCVVTRKARAMIKTSRSDALRCGHIDTWEENQRARRIGRAMWHRATALQGILRSRSQFVKDAEPFLQLQINGTTLPICAVVTITSFIYSRQQTDTLPMLLKDPHSILSDISEEDIRASLLHERRALRDVVQNENARRLLLLSALHASGASESKLPGPIRELLHLYDLQTFVFE